MAVILPSPLLWVIILNLNVLLLIDCFYFYFIRDSPPPPPPGGYATSQLGISYFITHLLWLRQKLSNCERCAYTIKYYMYCNIVHARHSVACLTIIELKKVHVKDALFCVCIRTFRAACPISAPAPIWSFSVGHTSPSHYTELRGESLAVAEGMPASHGSSCSPSTAGVDQHTPCIVGRFVKRYLCGASRLWYHTPSGYHRQKQATGCQPSVSVAETGQLTF